MDDHFDRVSFDGDSLDPSPRGSITRRQYLLTALRWRVPLWLGCATCCAVLVVASGLAHMALAPGHNDAVVGTGVHSFAVVAKLLGAVQLGTWINQIASVLTVGGDAYLNTPLTYASGHINVSDPDWDLPWVKTFIAHHYQHPERNFFYLDLASGRFTGLYSRFNSSVTTRVQGTSSGTATVEYVLLSNVSSPVLFSAGVPSSLYFPMADLFAQVGGAVQLISPVVTPFGNMMTGFGGYIPDRRASMLRGVMLEMIPVEAFIAPNLAQVGELKGNSVVFDDLGGLVYCSYEPLVDIFVPPGTPGAVCSTVTYGGSNTTLCRHSIETVRSIWPQLYEAATTLDINHRSVVDELSLLFYYDRVPYIACLTVQKVVGTSTGLWWGGVVTDAQPMYGAYFNNRNRVAVYTIVLSLGMSVLVAACAAAMIWPLRTILENITEALMLSKDHKYLVLPCSETDVTRVEITELSNIERAGRALYAYLFDIALLLPPAVVARIRSKKLSFAADSIDSVADANMAVEADESEQLLASASSPSSNEHLQNMLILLESYRRSRTVDDDSLTTVESNPPAAQVKGDGQRFVESILVTPSVAFKPARRKGFFLGVSLRGAGLPLQPDGTRLGIHHIIHAVKSFHGDVEIVEENVLLASFGCYSEKTSAANDAVNCAFYVRECFSRTEHASKLQMVIDCAWFESAQFTCRDGDRNTTRREIVTTPATESVIRLLPLLSVLCEDLIITDDAIRQMTVENFPRAPIVVDNVRFGSSGNCRLTRRGSVLLFAVPGSFCGTFGCEEAKLLAKAFRLMMKSAYCDAEIMLKSHDGLTKDASYFNSAVTYHRVLGLCGEFAKYSSEALLSPYFRNEVTLFEMFPHEHHAVLEDDGTQRATAGSSIVFCEKHEIADDPPTHFLQ